MKFERIVREALVMGGQARIRDTGITVNEIVRLSLDGKSQADILEEFPQLEAEDVHQALGWQIVSSKQLSLNYLHEIRVPLTAVRGYSDLLLFEGKHPDNIIEMLKYIKQNSEQVNALIHEHMMALKNPST